MTDLANSTFTYVPPTQLQDLPIWSLVIQRSREEKVSEFNFSKKSAFALNTWDKAMQRFNKAIKTNKYAPVVGIVSDQILTIDIDHHKELPEPFVDLLADHPTHHHLSKSGNGWKIYYFIDKPTPKKMMKHQYGEVFCGMFVTTTDPDLTDFSDEYVASITLEQLTTFIPELGKALQPRAIQVKQGSNPNLEYIDLDKMLAEVQRMLAIVPVDIDNLLEIAYETRMKDFELNSYTHWLLVSHALADLALQLASEYPTVIERLQLMFHEWSAKGSTYKNETDCNERFERSIKETQTTSEPIVSFNSLRKIFWSYRIPISDFPVVKVDKQGIKTIDATDPENYEFLIEFLNIALYQEISRGYHYIKGPASLIKTYFQNDQFYYLTSGIKDISIPFAAKPKSDDDLIYRLIKLCRHYGIKNAGRTHPIFAGLNKIGTKQIDILYEWMTSKPWDQKKRVEALIKESITLDYTTIPTDVPRDFCYKLILKHLTHMAGLRAKAYRTINNQLTVNDRFRKPQGILILAGYQNTRKSTWIECLLPTQAGFVSNITPSSVKDTLEIQRAVTGTFILNIDEVDAVLDNLNLSDFKNVITQDKDSFRTMYSQTFDDHPRAAGMFGTTNKTLLKLDRTGNRRFWVIPIDTCDAQPFIKCDYQQVWAELLHYAEKMPIEEWSISGQEKRFINEIDNQFMKQTISAKSLEMAFTDKHGDSILFSHDEFDFDKLFNNFPQKLQRMFINDDLFFPVHGNKCFIHLQNLCIMNENVDFKLGSFNHEIAGFLDNLLGFQNETRTYEKIIYKQGVVSYNTGKPKPSLYHFLPYKAKLMKYIDKELIPETCLKPVEEKD
jgi:hypothetical protein